MVLCIKESSGENGLMFWLRQKYYRLVERLSSVRTIQNYTGFGLYDRRVVDTVRSFGDAYPYFRGIIAEIGLPAKYLYFHQPARRFGITKNNWYILYDIAMLGITNLSKVPLRLAVFSGFIGALLSFLIGLAYLVYKLLFWQRFTLGIAPIVIGIFFISSIQLVFMGIIGEYVGAIHTQVLHRPFVTELERINFEYPAEPPETAPTLATGNNIPLPHTS
jgi:glycosyltransferase involved in cell wall biosynthesis